MAVSKLAEFAWRYTAGAGCQQEAVLIGTAQAHETQLGPIVNSGGEGRWGGGGFRLKPHIEVRFK